MGQVRLIRLTLRNFKGLQHFVFEPDGRNTAVFGDNGTGKTTLFDGFNWLLFGKDSLNRADFEIKCLDASGEAAHGLEHEVEAALTIEHFPDITLRKVLTEKWVKKRGSATSEFTGHQVAHFVDGVPRTEKEYKEIVSRIADETTFKLLTNPRYFSEHMKWPDRRKTLLDVCGDISDADVIASDPQLLGISEMLGTRTLEDHRKVLASRRSAINEQLRDLPARISENQGMITANDADPEAVKAELRKLSDRKSKLQQDVVTAKTGGAVAAKTKELREVESQILVIDGKASEAKLKYMDGKRTELARARLELDGIPKSRAGIEVNDTKIAGYKTEMEVLRNEWFAIDAQKFEYNAEGCTCPTCGQQLPENKIAEARAKAEADFNQRKADKLKKINSDGNQYKLFIKRLTLENQDMEAKLGAGKTRIGELQALIAKLEADIEHPPLKETPPEWSELAAKKSALESEISELQLGSHDLVDELQGKIAELDTQIQQFNTILGQIENNKKAAARIEQLKSDERRLAGDYEQVERELFLCEAFIKQKVSLLTEKINSRFRITRFKLFEQQINGGISECCEATLNGVPYSGNLSNSERLRVGLDIISTLSEAYGQFLPVFADNAESTTQFPEMQSQMIRLYVSEPDKALRIELEAAHAKAA